MISDGMSTLNTAQQKQNLEDLHYLKNLVLDSGLQMLLS